MEGVATTTGAGMDPTPIPGVTADPVVLVDMEIMVLVDTADPVDMAIMVLTLMVDSAGRVAPAGPVVPVVQAVTADR